MLQAPYIGCIGLDGALANLCLHRMKVVLALSASNMLFVSAMSQETSP